MKFEDVGISAFCFLAVICGIFNIGYLMWNSEGVQAKPNIVIENVAECQINCTQCLEYCNTIIDDALQTYIKVRGIGQTVAIREGYT